MLARALFVACELNIAEYLEKKPMTLHQLATTTGTHKQALGSLMYFLELNDIFTKHSMVPIT